MFVWLIKKVLKGCAPKTRQDKGISLHAPQYVGPSAMWATPSRAILEDVEIEEGESNALLEEEQDLFTTCTWVLNVLHYCNQR